MAGPKAQATLARATLPSVRLADLADELGVSVDLLGEFIKTDKLPCHILLRGETGEIPTPAEICGGGPGPGRLRMYQPPPERVPLDGHYRLPTQWAAAAFDRRCTSTPSVVVGEGESERLVRVPEIRPTRRDLRVLRANVERFQRDVLSHQFVSSIQTAPAVRQSVLDQQRCKAVAAYMWSKDREATIVDVAKSQGIQKFALEGRQYTEEVVHRWIREFCPNRRPGRRKSS